MREQDHYPLPDGSLPPPMPDLWDEKGRSPTSHPFLGGIIVSVGLWGLVVGILYLVFIY